MRLYFALFTDVALCPFKYIRQFPDILGTDRHQPLSLRLVWRIYWPSLLPASVIVIADFPFLLNDHRPGSRRIPALEQMQAIKCVVVGDG